jgi:hypothetical protein
VDDASAYGMQEQFQILSKPCWRMKLNVATLNPIMVTFAVVHMLPRGVTAWIGKEFLVSKIVTTDLMLLGANTEC